MKGPGGYLARFWRRIHPGRNPLARASDRVEAALLAIAVLGVLLAVPLAATAGSVTYARQLAVSAEQTATRHSTKATLLAEAPDPVASTDASWAVNNVSEVSARWQLDNGVQRIGSVEAKAGTPAGATVPIWISDAGDLVPPPVTPADAVNTGVLMAVLLWLGVAGALAGLFRAARWLLDRRRAAQWDLAWAQASGDWTRS